MSIQNMGLAKMMTMGAWQPIKTAPTDGSEFLACSVTEITAKGSPCVWHAAYASGDPWPESCCDGEPLYEASHWMPLPDPPK